MKKNGKKILAVLLIIVLALIAYGIIPAVITTSPSSMHSGDTYYIYGTVNSRMTVDNSSIIEIDDSGHYFYVFYNGSAPAIGSHVLVHGEYSNILFTNTINATSIYPWYYAL